MKRLRQQLQDGKAALLEAEALVKHKVGSGVVWWG